MKQHLFFYYGLGIVSLMMLGSLCSCDDEGGKSNKYEPIVISRAEEELVEDYNSFTCKLMGQIGNDANYLAGRAPENIIVSPLSLAIDLSMLANGTAGETRMEIINTLGFETEDIETVNSLNKKLLEQLPCVDKSSKVRIANAVWFDSRYLIGNVRSSYADLLKKSYFSPCTVLDQLSSVESMNIINRWAKDNTDGLIKKFLSEPLPDEATIALTNALYFKGIWGNKFEKSLTVKDIFKNSDGMPTRVEMMHNPEIKCQSYQEDNYKIAALTYGNGAYSMIIILPEEGRDPITTFSEINVSDLTNLIKGESYSKFLDVKLPHFEIESNIEFISMLKVLGIQHIFSGGDFSEMADFKENIAIRKILQTANIKVDEEGTEAAAVTIISGWPTSPGPMLTNEFYVDHPFAFAIAERSTGAILFAGAVRRL